MRIHYLNCGTDCPVGGALFDGFSKGPLARLSCAAQLIETNDGLVLIDTGYGTQDVRDPHPRLSKTFHALLNIQFRMEETAIHQVKALGFSPSDVRHIVLTHLDFDHAGGIEDFPHARVHVMEAERDSAERKRRGFISRRRYRPVQWDDVRDWRTYSGGGERWFGFDSVRNLEGLPREAAHRLLGKTGREWVDRHDAPGGNIVAVSAGSLPLGASKRERPRTLLQRAADNDFLTDVHGVCQVLVEPCHAHPARLVRQLDHDSRRAGSPVDL